MLTNRFWNTVDRRILSVEYDISDVKIKKVIDIDGNIRGDSNFILTLISLKKVSDSTED